jgi:hypothetical protein
MEAACATATADALRCAKNAGVCVCGRMCAASALPNMCRSPASAVEALTGGCLLDRIVEATASPRECESVRCMLMAATRCAERAPALVTGHSRGVETLIQLAGRPGGLWRQSARVLTLASAPPSNPIAMPGGIAAVCKLVVEGGTKDLKLEALFSLPNMCRGRDGALEALRCIGIQNIITLATPLRVPAVAAGVLDIISAAAQEPYTESQAELLDVDAGLLQTLMCPGGDVMRLAERLRTCKKCLNTAVARVVK